MKLNFIIITFLLTSLISCTSGNSSQEQSAKYQEPSNTSNTSQPEIVPIEKHEDVEVQEESDVEIEDYITEEDEIKEEDDEPYIVDAELPQTASERMAELIKDTDYIRSSGKLKRAKLAKKLNKEDFRKSDGSKFRRRDIPKYP